MSTITYYDLASEYYLAYVLNGLVSEVPNWKCKIRVSKMLPPILDGLILPNNDSHRIFSLGLFKVNSSKGCKWLCIDAHDDSSIEGYFHSVLERVDYYFKLNLDPIVIKADPYLAHYSEKIHPLGCAFPIGFSSPWSFLPRPLPCKLYAWDWLSIKRRILSMNRLPSIEWYRELRKCQPIHDVFLVRRYYTELEHADSNENYFRVFESARHTGLGGHLGFTGNPNCMPYKIKEHFLVGNISYREHVTMTSACRVCLYLPGVYNCLSFKFGQYLALGKPIVGLKLPFWPLTDMTQEDISLLEEQFCCTEPEEIPAKVVELLGDSEKISALNALNIRLFERYFSPAAVGRRILHTVMK